jgi:hypothetical protein
MAKCRSPATRDSLPGHTERVASRSSAFVEVLDCQIVSARAALEEEARRAGRLQAADSFPPETVFHGVTGSIIVSTLLLDRAELRSAGYGFIVESRRKPRQIFAASGPGGHFCQRDYRNKKVRKGIRKPPTSFHQISLIFH